MDEVGRKPNAATKTMTTMSTASGPARPSQARYRWPATLDEPRPARRPRRPGLAALAAGLLLQACDADGAAGRQLRSVSAPTATPGDGAPAAAREPTAGPDGTVDPPTFRRTRELMSTIMQITVVGEETPRRAAAVDAAFAEIERLEGLLSEWRPDSEISAINRAAGQTPVKVSEDTLAVVRAGLSVSRWSEGAFDLSWAALRGLYSFQPGEERIPTDSEIRARLPLIAYRQIVVDEVAHTVFLRKSGMTLGTGGIAKGYALDRAGQVLRNAGIEQYMLFGGGQVQVQGRKGSRPWRVGIQHPRQNDYFAFLTVEGGSISTSGDYEHAFVRNGKRWHHLVDLQTGRPIDHTTSVTVLADSGLYADALSTAIFAMGAERAQARLSHIPGHARFVSVDNEMKVHLGGNLTSQLVFRGDLGNEGRLP